MTDRHGDDIDRQYWNKMFEHGYKLGAKERRRAPKNRRDDVTDIHEVVDYSKPEIEAMQAGFEEGQKNAVPGEDPNIEEKANAAFDESGHAPSLSDWGDA